MSSSSSKVEYMTLSKLTWEIQWLQYLLAYLHVPVIAPFVLYYNNKSIIHLAHNPIFHERIKHIELIVMSKDPTMSLSYCHLLQFLNLLMCSQNLCILSHFNNLYPN